MHWQAKLKFDTILPKATTSKSKNKKGRKNQMKKENEAKKFIKNAKTVGAVHTQVVIKGREITQNHCVYISWAKRQIMQNSI